MAVPIIKSWKNYFENPDEGLGSSYERVVTNILLLKLVKHFDIQTVLEAPSFGFTGTSGINSMELAKNGCYVTVADNDKERIDLIKGIWEKCNISANIVFASDFSNLKFENNQFDMSWNFASLWHVKDMKRFFKELSRVTKKVIAIFVPNIYGIGYKFLKYTGGKNLKNIITEENIFPKNIINSMEQNGWKLWQKGFIDCPPWPDIGMPKDKFFKMFGIKIKNKENAHPLTILDYYCDKDNSFYDKMLKYDFLENNLPEFLKRIWSHHQWFVFLPDKK